MNDITALAEQLRATAEKANEHGEFNMAMHTVQVLALVEALEASQQDSDGVAGMAEHYETTISMLKSRIVELEESHAQVIQARDHYKRMAEEGLKGLEESRTVTAAASDVLAERQRQMSVEGWTPKHDDQYSNNELAFAASCYAFHAATASWDLEDNGTLYDSHPAPKTWPWHAEWWKPTNPRRDLVKAAALILAEIERIDRAAGIQVIEGEQKNG